MNSYPFQLSGGMKQRVCIAMAIATKRQLLLADEPGTSLDVTIQDQILRLIDKLTLERHLSVIMLSHSLGVIREFTSFVNIMYAGSIVRSGKTEDVFTILIILTLWL
jgi:peptide/nickel transport system ATP-binding protein